MGERGCCYFNQPMQSNRFVTCVKIKAIQVNQNSETKQDSPNSMKKLHSTLEMSKK